MPTFSTYEMKQSFSKSAKYLWRYGIFAETVYMLKVENFKSCRWAKFSPCHCKTKIPAHVKFSAQMPTCNTYEMMQSFWKFVKYLWRYWIFCATVYRYKVGNFKSCRWAKFSPCHCKSKIRAHLKFSAQIATFNKFEMKQIFRKSVKYFGDMGFLLGQFTCWKWKISNLVDGLSFHLVFAKLKYLLTWNFRPNAHFHNVWDEAKFLKIGETPLEI